MGLSRLPGAPLVYMKGTDIQRNEVTSPANQRDTPPLRLPSSSQIVHHCSSVCPDIA